MKQEGTALAVFDRELPQTGGDVSVLVGPGELREMAQERGFEFVDLDELRAPESVYEGADLMKEISTLAYPSGRRIASAVVYEGFELWWTHYNALLRNFCLPYTEYKNVLAHLSRYEKVYLYEAPYRSLFVYYLEAQGTRVVLGKSARLRSPSLLPFGIVVQIIYTALSVLALGFLRRPVMVFIGDKIQAGKDFDYRMGSIYAQLRARNIPFMECIRSLESWRTVVRHAGIRRRPAVYSEAVQHTARGLNFFSTKPLRASTLRELGGVRGSDSWKVRVAVHYLLSADEDVLAIRITRAIFKFIGIRVGVFTAILERNVHAALACKLLTIPTIGILHGVASVYSTPYDFLPGFEGKRMLTTDLYGVWSQWWKEYFEKESDAYRKEQLVVSGPMRPLTMPPASSTRTGHLKVLFMSEQRATPAEVLPYLRALLKEEDIKVTIKFRPFRDGFEEWLQAHDSNLLSHPRLSRVKGTMEEALVGADAVVGCHSTGVLEGLLQGVVPIFMYTKKWGDYYGMGESPERSLLLAKIPDELIAKVRAARATPQGLLNSLREQYFGTPGMDGSAWLASRVETLLRDQKLTVIE